VDSQSQSFNSAISHGPGQFKRTKLSTRSTTPPRSRLQSLLTGQSYIPPIDASPPMFSNMECSGSSSKLFSISQEPLAGSIKGESANGIFDRSEEDESAENTEQEIYGGDQFDDTEEDQEGFQEFEQDDTMNSEGIG